MNIKYLQFVLAVLHTLIQNYELSLNESPELKVENPDIASDLIRALQELKFSRKHIVSGLEALEDIRDNRDNVRPPQRKEDTTKTDA